MSSISISRVFFLKNKVKQEERSKKVWEEMRNTENTHRHVQAQQRGLINSPNVSPPWWAANGHTERWKQEGPWPACKVRRGCQEEGASKLSYRIWDGVSVSRRGNGRGSLGLKSYKWVLEDRTLWESAGSNETREVTPMVMKLCTLPQNNARTHW